MPPQTNARRRRQDPPDEFTLSSERDNREALSLFRVPEEVVISPLDRFAIVPGPKGHGWTLLIQRDTPA